MFELPATAVYYLLGSTGVLLLLLVASFLSRPRVFTQYLAHMTGIRLSHRDVAQVFKDRGQAGVRDLFIEMIVREDLREGHRITPDTPPDRNLLIPDENGR